MFLRGLFGVEQAPKKPEPKQEQQQLGVTDAVIHHDPFGLQLLQRGFAGRQEEMISGSPDFSPGQQG